VSFITLGVSVQSLIYLLLSLHSTFCISCCNTWGNVAMDWERYCNILQSDARYEAIKCCNETRRAGGWVALQWKTDRAQEECKNVAMAGG